MKSLAFGVVLILLIGVAGFFYRSVMEKGPVAQVPVCTLEAKVCPDGSSVGRTGPACSFAPCPPPNVERADLGISFVLPQGYVENKAALGEDPTLKIGYEKSATGGSGADAIVVRAYPLPEGKTANDVMLANTILETSDTQVTSLKQFSPVIINNKTFYSITTERFEAQVHTLYYLPREKDVLRFEVLERNVKEWTDPKLVIADLPEHKALLYMLASLQVH